MSSRFVSMVPRTTFTRRNFDATTFTRENFEKLFHITIPILYLSIIHFLIFRRSLLLFRDAFILFHFICSSFVNKMDSYFTLEILSSYCDELYHNGSEIVHEMSPKSVNIIIDEIDIQKSNPSSVVPFCLIGILKKESSFPRETTVEDSPPVPIANRGHLKNFTYNRHGDMIPIRGSPWFVDQWFRIKAEGAMERYAASRDKKRAEQCARRRLQQQSL